MVEEHDRGAVALVFGRGEAASRDRRDANGRQEIRRDETDEHALRLAVAGEVRGAAGVRRKRGEDVALVGVVGCLGRRKPGLRPVRPMIPDHHQPVRLSVGQRLEQHRIQHAEHRRVCADAERNCQHRSGGESGLVPKPAPGVRGVLSHSPEQLVYTHAFLPAFRRVVKALARQVEAGRAPEPSQRLGVCLFARHAAPHELLDAQLEVRLDLLVDRGVQRSSADGEAEEAAHAAHVARAAVRMAVTVRE